MRPTARPRPASGNHGRLLHGRRRRRGGRGGLRGVPRPRPLADRKKAVECIRTSASTRPRTGPRSNSRRPRSAGSITRSPSSETPSPDARRRVSPDRKLVGDDGLTLTDYAPFGVIGAITPVTHSLPTLAATRSTCLRRGIRSSSTPIPRGRKIAAEGVRRFNKAIRAGDRPRQPAHHHRPAHPRIGRRAVRSQGDQPSRRHRRSGRGSRGPGEQAASDRRRPGQPPGGR